MIKIRSAWLGIIFLPCFLLGQAGTDSSPQNQRLCQRFCGVYEVTPGWIITLAMQGPDFVYQDFHSGRLALLQPAGENSLTVGPNLSDPAPVEITFWLAENLSSLVVQEQSYPQRTARKLDFRREEVTFRNGSVTLAGTLTRPDTKGPHPAVLIVPGGGSQDRNDLQIGWWVYHGFAVLAYDKRGVGKSAGKLSNASIPDLAGDALGAFDLLKSHREIDKTQIGLVGHSEAGFVAPVVASRSRDVAFLIVTAAPALPTPEQVVHELASDMRCDGFSEADIVKAKVLRGTLNDVVLHDRNWNELKQSIQSAQSEKWFRASRVSKEWLNPPAALIETHWRYLQFDPLPVWKKVTAPVLVIGAERDTQIDASHSMRTIGAALTEGGNKDHTLTLFPASNHIFLESGTGCSDEYPRLRRIVPGYFGTVMSWALRHTLKRAKT